MNRKEGGQRGIDYEGKGSREQKSGATGDRGRKGTVREGWRKGRESKVLPGRRELPFANWEDRLRNGFMERNRFAFG